MIGYSLKAAVCGVLLAAKAKAEATDHVGKTALHRGCERGHEEVVQRLLEARASQERSFQQT